jgi:hypothetical protein
MDSHILIKKTIEKEVSSVHEWTGWNCINTCYYKDGDH